MTACVWNYILAYHRRWHGLRREDRACKECGSGEVEDTEHFVMSCVYVVKERKRLENLMSSRVKGWRELGEMRY